MASPDNANQTLSFTITQNDKTVTVTENTVIDMLRQLVKIRGNTYTDWRLEKNSMRFWGNLCPILKL